MVLTTFRKSVKTYSVYHKGRKRTYRESFKREKEEETHPCPSSNQSSSTVLESTPSTSSQPSTLDTLTDFVDVTKDNRYTTAKQTRIEEWSAIREAMFNVGVAACAPSTNVPSCNHCGKEDDVFHCLDCHQWNVFCHDCLMSRHQFPHLHMFEAWKCGTFIGYNTETPAWTLNHNCETFYYKDLVIVDDKGRQHLRNIQFCRCEVEPATLLRFGLWPSSPKYPRLAFDVELLKWLKALLLECHVSVKGFCESLKARFPKYHQGYISSEMQDIYKILITETFEEFRHFSYRIERLDHVNSNLDDGTQCSACFQMPEKIFSFDADFQLVRKASAGKSWDTRKHKNHFFLEQDEVDSFVESYSTDSKKTNVDCNDFQAGNALRSKVKTKKLEETAVFGSMCRHEFPKYFFSLKHGERLGYAVFLLQKLKDELPEDADNIRVMYDIACVLHSHIKRQGNEELLSNVSFSIPIFHCYGHKMKCQILYSPRKNEGFGLTDGESLERLWSYLGKFSRITKEMTPENRVDLLVDGLLHYGQKIKEKMVNSLVSKHKKANEMENTNRKALDDTLAQLEGVTIDAISKWMDEDKKAAVQGNDVEEKYSISEEYSLALESLFSTNDDTSQNNKEKLNKVIRKLEKKLCVCWDIESNEYKENLRSAKEKKKKIILRKIRQNVSERVYLTELIKKYAKGQSIAVRLSKQISRVVLQINGDLKEYNNIQFESADIPQSLSFNEVRSLESVIWQVLESPVSESVVPSSLRQQLVHLKASIDRSVEEQHMLKAEMMSVFSWHKSQHEILIKEVEEADLGLKCLLIREGLYLEKKMVGMKTAFEPFIGEIVVPHTYSEMISVQLVTHSQRVWALLENDISEILEYENKEDANMVNTESDDDVSSDEENE